MFRELYEEVGLTKKDVRIMNIKMVAVNMIRPIKNMENQQLQRDAIIARNRFHEKKSDKVDVREFPDQFITKHGNDIYKLPVSKID